MRIRQKLWEWTCRYGVGEILGTIGALGGARLLYSWTHNETAAAYGGSISEVIGFWGSMFARDCYQDAQRARAAGKAYGIWGGLRTMRDLLIECGPAELFDTGLIRPLAMGVFAHYMDRDLGIFLGKLVGDVFFYIPAIMTYEARQWLRRSNRTE